MRTNRLCIVPPGGGGGLWSLTLARGGGVVTLDPEGGGVLWPLTLARRGEVLWNLTLAGGGVLCCDTWPWPEGGCCVVTLDPGQEGGVVKLDPGQGVLWPLTLARGGVMTFDPGRGGGRLTFGAVHPPPPPTYLSIAGRQVVGQVKKVGKSRTNSKK